MAKLIMSFGSGIISGFALQGLKYRGIIDEYEKVCDNYEKLCDEQYRRTKDTNRELEELTHEMISDVERFKKNDKGLKEMSN